MQKLFLKDFLQKLKSNYIKFKKPQKKTLQKFFSKFLYFFLAKKQKVRGTKKHKETKNTKNLSILS